MVRRQSLNKSLKNPALSAIEIVRPNLYSSSSGVGRYRVGHTPACGRVQHDDGSEQSEISVLFAIQNYVAKSVLYFTKCLDIMRSNSMVVVECVESASECVRCMQNG